MISNSKQKIALDFGIIEMIFTQNSVYNMAAKWHKFEERFSPFNQAVTNIVKWEKDIENLKTKSDEFQNYTIALLKLDYYDVPFEDFNDCVRSTDDKIGISNNLTNEIKDFMIYTLDMYLDNKYDHRCRLYRIPKNIVIKPKTNLGNLEILDPFLRNAEVVEIMDSYFFKDTKKDNLIYIRLLNTLLEKCNNAKKIIIHFYNDKVTLAQFDFWKNSLNKKFQKLEVVSSRYNVKSNHDRYIVIDHDAFSITTTTSWNNIEFKDNQFFSPKGFQLSIETGRIYLDYANYNNLAR